MSRLDLWLLLMAFFWGSNFTVIKVALTEMPGPAFNGLRMVLASGVVIALIAWRGALAGFTGLLADHILGLRHGDFF